MFSHDLIAGGIGLSGGNATFATAAQVKTESIKDYAQSIFDPANRNFLVLPSSRSGVNGFYFVTSKSSSWVSLPHQKKLPVSDSSSVAEKFDPYTDCFQFKNVDDFSGRLFVTISNYKENSHPALISNQQPSNRNCKETKLSNILDEEFKDTFEKALITKIDTAVQAYKNRKAFHQSITNPKDRQESLRGLESVYNLISEAINECTKVLNDTLDKEIIKALEVARKTLNDPNRLSPILIESKASQ